ncbi:MAG TPA: endolytic transglycosylase MltG, partial [Chitinophagaceae bacterium]|nr:endolytic transglycosylase MltG [Chitinophagaceae bacterium]
MKKLITFFIILLILGAGFLAWLIMGPSTGFKEEFKYLYISSNNPTKDSILKIINRDSITWHEATFEKVADRMDYWRHIKPGKYKIEKGSSVLSVVRKLKNGQQEPVNLVILKFRTKEALAGAMGKKLECDSASLLAFMNDKDSMGKYGLDSNTAMSILFPNTYTLNWNTTPRKVFNKFYEEH